MNDFVTVLTNPDGCECEVALSDVVNKALEAGHTFDELRAMLDAQELEFNDKL